MDSSDLVGNAQETCSGIAFCSIIRALYWPISGKLMRLHREMLDPIGVGQWSPGGRFAFTSPLNLISYIRRRTRRLYSAAVYYTL
jgi:hypothetical protein